MDTRKTLESAGEHMAGHLLATRLFGAGYSDAEYVQAVTVGRERGVGELYADKVVGVDPDGVIEGVADEGEETVRAAERLLRSRGVNPGRASYREYADALVAVSS